MLWGVETRMAVASLRNCSKLHDTCIVPFTPSMFEPSNLARRVMEKRRRGLDKSVAGSSHGKYQQILYQMLIAKNIQLGICAA